MLKPELIISNQDKNMKYDNFNSLADHRHPNIIKFDDFNRLYVGDSLGTIHVYEIQNN